MQNKDIHIHSQLFAAWEKMIENRRFPHTVLLSGKTGYGALFAAWRLAEKLLCAPEYDACIQQVRHLSHPDLHFVFPTATTKKISKDPSATDFTDEWRAFFSAHPFGSYAEWMDFMGATDKKGEIRVKDALDLIHRANLYPVAGTNKVFIIWLAERMNLNAANKLLKLLEEPPEDAYFILTTENEAQILPTILSRCQIFPVPKIPNAEMERNLEQFVIEDRAHLKEIVRLAGGDWNLAMKYHEDEDPNKPFKENFVKWVRIAYSARNNPKAIVELKEWAEQLAGEGNAYRVNFLRFAMEIFRQAYLEKTGAGDLTYLRFDEQNFRLERFAPFVHAGNVEDFYRALNDAVYHLNRNANPKITLLDLSIKLTRLLHKPEPSA